LYLFLPVVFAGPEREGRREGGEERDERQEMREKI
jgi:hypothetical protein